MCPRSLVASRNIVTKPKGLAVVRINGTDHYLGKYDSPESWEKYHRLLAESISTKPGNPSPQSPKTAEATADLTINQVLNAYRKFAETYYVKGGQPTKELTEMKYAARPVRELYGRSLAREFGPISLKAVRQHMIDSKVLSRGVINHRVNRIRRIFKWAVSEELIPPSVFQSIASLEPLRYGRTSARETDPVKPIPWEAVEPGLAVTSSVVMAMIKTQWFTGMRPCEVVIMRACDIDTSGEIWIYEPQRLANISRKQN